MTPQLRILFVCNLGICLIAAATLLFYRYTQKIHRGFDFWVASTVLTALGHLVNFLRLGGASTVVAVVLGNLFYPVLFIEPAGEC